MTNLVEVKTNILRPFVDETIKALKSMAALEAEAGDFFEDDIEKFRFKGYAVATKTDGAISGVILMHFYIETALEIGNRVLGHIIGLEPASEITEDIAAALEEFGNTAIGLAMNDVVHSDESLNFCPPFFITNTEDMGPLLNDVNEVISAPISVNGVGRFYFNYLIHS